ncbi:CGP-CTERM sorting domain-containing protein, partial [Thermococcus alcaliphilus]|nr:CGP-CTERM sorting domain-containing protein [Thermococcus alcaliphilus]
FFNPFACRDIRYALNFLISRQYIVQNILQGSGQPMLGGIRPSTGANAHFEPVYSALGITAQGNKLKALQMIENAMQKAAQDLAAQGYTLEKINGTWYFNGEPVTLKFIIRIEDHRKDLGLYVADLIERFWGFKVERLLWDRR